MHGQGQEANITQNATNLAYFQVFDCMAFMPRESQSNPITERILPGDASAEDEGILGRGYAVN